SSTWRAALAGSCSTACATCGRVPRGAICSRSTAGTTGPTTSAPGRTATSRAACRPRSPTRRTTPRPTSCRRSASAAGRTTPVRAAKADVLAFTAESRSDSPDVFVGGPTLRDAAQATATNPFLGDYAWTHEELVAYTSERGRRLQGVLLYPAGYDASKKYPMI